MTIITVMVLLGIGSIIWFLSRSSRPATTESFLVSNRNIPFFLGTMTVLATWTQAFALVVGATFAYQSEWNFIWFIVPNVCAVILLGVFAPMIQDAVPRGYTLPQVVEKTFGPNVRTVYSLSAFASLVYIIASTMTALQQWISQQLHVAPWQISLVLGAFAFLWVIRRGLPAAVIGDVVKVTLIVAGLAGVIALHLYHSGTVFPKTTSAQAVTPGSAFWMMGVPLFVTLLAGALCNPDIGGRAYAIDRRTVRRAYFCAAGLFAVIVGTYGSLGFLARNLGLNLSNTQPPALAILQATVPVWFVLIVTLALVVILAAALASMFASAGDLATIEIYRRFVNPGASDVETVRWSRIFMVLTVLLGTIISAFNLDLSLLIQSAAVIRGETVIPLFLALFWPRHQLNRAVFWGMIAGVIGGVMCTFGANIWEGVFHEKMSFLLINGRPLGALIAFFTPLVFYIVALMRQMRNDNRSGTPEAVRR